MILAAGRILGELRHAFPGVDEHFDNIVAENGALISGPHGRRLLADPVDQVLEDALLRRRIPVRAGAVLLACDAAHDLVVLEEIGRLGLDCQILRDRAALMVLPAGVTKGSGLLEALGDLGVSRHSTITVGDAENDRRLLEVGEYGVAVANAVEALLIRRFGVRGPRGGTAARPWSASLARAFLVLSQGARRDQRVIRSKDPPAWLTAELEPIEVPAALRKPHPVVAELRDDRDLLTASRRGARRRPSRAGGEELRAGGRPGTRQR